MGTPGVHDETVEILNVVPLRGSGGIIGASCEAAARLAELEINSGSGILGREARITTIDGGGPADEVAREVSAFLATGMVHAITGIPMPDVRAGIMAAADGRVPCLFGIGDEGHFGPRRGVFMIGENPGAQTVAALEWLHREFGAHRWAIVASDYIWSRLMVPTLRGLLDRPHELVAEYVFPLGTEDFGAALDDPRLDTADGVIVLLVGGDAARFNRAFAASGRADHQFRTGPTADENLLAAGGPFANANIYVPSSVIPDPRLRTDRERLERYHRLHGRFAPSFSRFATCNYQSLHVLQGLTAAAKSIEVDRIHTTVDSGLVLDRATGEFTLSGNQFEQPVRVCRANGAEFEPLVRV
ncbi:ABC-type branched-subunit amino acid transport system substrate-binding protein [Nocardia transvalensis]|uniref:ABC-type branched-subunit amino acid transport system substrate-binding protein n=1 Tax=Nocardia transvalensis TaxID=37333 RepID=A0A7W9UHB5_9NOCA|nr:ABC transporter substrate-binding protein [Nocardia transvalensis]MBB5913173.1 ABC-type branched-subunit amino acid transport system substrate-binding protein [Nocardia transvalensis]